MTPRDAYRKECAEVAAADPRWKKVGRDALDECVACGAFVLWLDPTGVYRCPGCHDWLADRDAPALPLTPKPVVVKIHPPIPCDVCKVKAAPIFRWKVSKTGKVQLGAHCPTCRGHLQWVSIEEYETAAPPRPDPTTTAGLFKGLGAALTYLDLEEEDRPKENAAKPVKCPTCETPNVYGRIDRRCERCAILHERDLLRSQIAEAEQGRRSSKLLHFDRADLATVEACLTTTDQTTRYRLVCTVARHKHKWVPEKLETWTEPIVKAKVAGGLF